MIYSITRYYSTEKRGKLLSYKKTREYFKCVLLSEIRQFEKDTCCMILTIQYSGKEKTADSKKISVFKGWRREIDDGEVHRAGRRWDPRMTSVATPFSRGASVSSQWCQLHENEELMRAWRRDFLSLGYIFDRALHKVQN